MALPSIFLDSSTVIAALLSVEGGSFYVITGQAGPCKLFVDEYVVAEVLQVFNKKYPKQTELRHALFALISMAHIEVLPAAPKSLIDQASHFINKKDAPILASALKQKCSHLLTLDKDFLGKKVLKFSKKQNLTILTPGDFIKNKTR